MTEKTIDYPFQAFNELERFDIVLDRQSATGVLSVGLLSQHGLGHYYNVTCNEEKMPFCQAMIERDSERFGHHLPQILVGNGLGHIVGESQEPGFRGYTIFQFDPDMLRGLDPAVFADYEQAAGIHQKAPITFNRQNIEGVEWRVAVQEMSGRQIPLAASVIGNPNAPVFVTPDKDSYALIMQGESPQSYETMKQAIGRANEQILSLPEQERTVYLVQPEGKEGIYQIGNSNYVLNAFWSDDHPGQICTEILDTFGVVDGVDGTKLYPDDIPFDQDPSLFDLHDGFTNIEECVQHVAEERLGVKGSQVEFVAPCGHSLETVGDYRNTLKAASKKDVSLDDLKQEAKERANEKTSSRTVRANDHRSPEPER